MNTSDRPDTRCPRCGGGFDCGAGKVEPCACTTVALDAGTLEHLRSHYEGCLCLRCLAVLATSPRLHATKDTR